MGCLKFVQPAACTRRGRVCSALRVALSRCASFFARPFFFRSRLAAARCGPERDGLTGRAFGDYDLDEDGVRPAMDSVYIEGDVLMGSMPLLRRRSQQPPSIIEGAKGLPNVLAPYFQAKESAAESRKWLIVNLQHPGTKRSEALNLIWAGDEFSNGLLAEECVLWQRDTSHAHAEPIINYYLDGRCPSAEDCPLVIMVDPRTGRALRRWKADMVVEADDRTIPLEPQLAFEQVTKFLEMHTLEGFSPPDSPQHSPVNSPQACFDDSADPPDFQLEELDSDGGEADEAETDMDKLKVQFGDGRMEACKQFDDVLSEEDKATNSYALQSSDKENIEQVPRSLSNEQIEPETGKPIRLLLRWPSGSRSEHEIMLDEPLSNIMTTAAVGLVQRAAPGEPTGELRAVEISDVLLETASPPLRELHRLPHNTPVRNLDLHRRVLNVRLRDGK